MRTFLLPIPASAVALSLVAGAAVAQPGNNSPNQYGDRQAGHFGDPGQGHFGNPAAGDFDKAKINEPRAGTKPMGKVYRGKIETPPYVTLPTPADAAAPAEGKPPAKKKRASEPKKTR